MSCANTNLLEYMMRSSGKKSQFLKTFRFKSVTPINVAFIILDQLVI